MGSERKAQIIRIAAAIFLHKGYSDTSLADVAQAAGIQTPSLFTHFRSKDELYQLVVENYLINAQTPNQKFGDIDHLSLKEFIDMYLLKVDETMRILRNVIKGAEKTSLKYFRFILEAVDRSEDYAQQALNFSEEEVHLWEKVIKNAMDKGEVRPDIDAKSIAEIFRFSYLGMSYTYTVKGGIGIRNAQNLFKGIYNTIALK